MNWNCIHGVSLSSHCPECFELGYTQRTIPAITTGNTFVSETLNQSQHIADLERQLTEARRLIGELQGELRQERGLKALLANGMPDTGNADFDEVLATQPIAAMIQRGWLPGITDFNDLPALESAICHFWSVKTIAEAIHPQFSPIAPPSPEAHDEQAEVKK